MSELSLCAIGLGSNLGDSRSILIGAIDRLQKHPQIELLAISSWYLTDPIGPPQPDYINGCATIETSLAPLDLLNILQAIESEFGRVRQEIWGARTLDLDLLLYDNLIIDLPTLQIPHPRMIERAFVLVPLAEIAPDSIEPKSGHSIATLCHKLEYSGVKLLQE
ncbi:2-amino-4-hydroxy-6-hydroxymethyldihydropteridine diphosphokinase [Chamaesiphon sp. VAR_48_metabat_135_sub]|uniref:2-amino-4-hydroxy-6- hydroxymethyldihydropteridine diphosphokinase n=1 Tax=Chamaesiphon sp. VAR_48_metabat_135_sub TaxID=2964699 RepID=UPI00286B7971|nr:2-amino-4-hydroxy-6-hydroxymethyldihydropteridine diphosphokinase [Chamaesiphon sp. VAR_48_metabat_135_sub]